MGMCATSTITVIEVMVSRRQPFVQASFVADEQERRRETHAFIDSSGVFMPRTHVDGEMSFSLDSEAQLMIDIQVCMHVRA
jgi:hypothetical protein